MPGRNTQKIVDMLLDVEQQLHGTCRAYLETEAQERVLVIIERPRRLWKYMVAYYLPAHRSFTHQTTMDELAKAWSDYTARAELYGLGVVV
jgi:hypothetical protein